MHPRLWLIITTLLMTLPASADPRVDYRVSVMEGAHRHLKAIKSIVIDGAPQRQHLDAHVRALIDFGIMLPGLFPRASDGPQSEASTKIWQNPAEFRAAITQLEKSLVTLQQAASHGDGRQRTSAYYATLDACKNCHHQFRER